MGQGQAAVASELLAQAAREGHWLSIKNLHLATNWLSSLDEQLQSITDKHADFRLWLTTEPHPRFSTILAQSCLKVTYEVSIFFHIFSSFFSFFCVKGKLKTL